MKSPLIKMEVLAFCFTAFITPALADDGHVPPGDPCGSGPGVGTGNPCNGNNGNDGANGNAKAKVVYGTPPAFGVDRPEGANSGAFIAQIGDQNSAVIRQQSSSAYARFDQTGDRNRGTSDQRSGGDHYLSATQTGDDNIVIADQNGTVGHVAIISQSGNANAAAIDQRNGAARNGVLVRQTGDDNLLAMLQDGSDNQTLLTQEGDGNEMTAAQTGDGNRLIWTQRGNNISNLNITQSGAQAMSVTQTR